MRLTYFQGDVPNFGDELNATLWDELVPDGFLDDDESELFLGIGSILWDHFPAAPTKHVMGSGYGGYTPPPNLHDGSWNVIFVRGPRTAATLGIPAEKVISDSAILVRLLKKAQPKSRSRVAFMPHFLSLDRGAWSETCALAGVRYIDPTKSVSDILSDIVSTDVLITEAMHGAIVADALRTPWIAVQPFGQEHHMKWLDWAESLGISLRRQPLTPSTSVEQYIKLTNGKARPGGPVRRTLQSPLAVPADYIFRHRAAASLQKLARLEPQLSDDSRISIATERAATDLDGFVRSRLPRMATA